MKKCRINHSINLTVLSWGIVCDGRPEHSDLAEEHGDEEGGAGGVVGGGQDEGYPGGDGEQGGRYEVGEHEVTMLASQIYVKTNDWVFMLSWIRVFSYGIIAFEILHLDMVSR